MKRTLDWDKYLETSARAVSGGIVIPSSKNLRLSAIKILT